MYKLSNLICKTIVQETMEEKCQAAVMKDTEIRQLRAALRERDSDIERANQMLLRTEEMIEVSVYV